MSTPHETAEWRWIPIYQRLNPSLPDKTLWAGATSYAIVPDGNRPTTWTVSDTRNGFTGTSISGLGKGVWHAYAKVTSSPDTPVIDCGTFTLD